MLFHIPKRSRGFTLIEIIIYVTLVTVLTSALIPFSWNVIQSGVKASVEQDVTSQARYLSERIKYEIRNADAINSVSATSLDLATATNPRTIIDLSGGKVRIRYGLTGTPIDLNSNATSVTSLLFTNRTSSDYKTQNIQYSFTISDTLTSARQEYSVPPTTIQGSVSVRTPILATPTPGGVPTATPVVPTNTPVPPTNTPVPPTPTAVPPSATPVGGWWAYRKQITIQDAQVTGTTNHTNFPVLINLSSDADLAARAQDDGDDIKFTASDGVTKLDHEIETFNGTTGAIIAWVEVSTLNATANTTIYMYYGNTVATNQENVTGTWSNGFAGVWHLQENGNGSANEYRDSTGRNNHGQGGAGITTAVPIASSGRIGNAQAFDGTDDYIQVTQASGLPAYNNTLYTVSFWLNPQSTSGTNHIYSESNSANNNSLFRLFSEGLSLNRMRVYIRNNADSTSEVDSGTATNSIPLNTWRYFAMSEQPNGGSSRLVTRFINGIQDSTNTYTQTAMTLNITTFGAMKRPLLGGPPYEWYYTGLIDELRVSTTNRSQDWLTTEYNNMSSPSTFYSLGAQQTM